MTCSVASASNGAVSSCACCTPPSASASNGPYCRRAKSDAVDRRDVKIEEIHARNGFRPNTFGISTREGSAADGGSARCSDAWGEIHPGLGIPAREAAAPEKAENPTSEHWLCRAQSEKEPSRHRRWFRGTGSDLDDSGPSPRPNLRQVAPETLSRARSANTATEAHTMTKAEVVMALLENLEARAETIQTTISLVVGSSAVQSRGNSVWDPNLVTDESAKSDSRSGSTNNQTNQLSHQNSKEDEYAAGELPEDAAPIEQVALIVPTTDDPSLPVWTFRTVVLGLFSCVLITFLNTYFSFRNEPIVITITTILIVTAPLGKFMAAVLPNKFVRVPGTQKGFSLNPGPFNMKEHALITIFASAGYSRPAGIYVFTMRKVFFKKSLAFFPAFMMTVTCELFGYSWAVLLQKFFVQPARMWWPGSLVNVSLIRGLYLDVDKRMGPSPLQFFVICFIVAFSYYVVPGLLMPTLGTVSVVCYIFKDSVLAQQIGSGNSGLGLGSISFDWATISGFLGSPLVVPRAAVLNIFVGFVIQAYCIVPLTYWKDWYHSKTFPMFSTYLYTRQGKVYSVQDLTGKEGRGGVQCNGLGYGNKTIRCDSDGFVDQGLTYFSAFYTVSQGVTFALFAAVISQVIFFNGRDIMRIFKDATSGRMEEPALSDVHTKLMKSYPMLPTRWTVMLFVGSYLAAMVTVVAYKDQFEMPWWGLFLGSIVLGVLIVPLTTFVATTNQVPNLGIISQYLMGFIRPGEPMTSIVFRTYSTAPIGRAGNYMGNFKLGHYMKIPPRATFLAQLISTFVASAVSVMVVDWLTATVDNICDPAKLPKNTPWTCPNDRVYYDQTIVYGLVGSVRVFTGKNAPYKTLNYYFIAGFLFPILVWLLRRALPNLKWVNRINAPLIVRGACLMPPSPIINNVMWIYVAFFFSTYVFAYHKEWWQRYNFVMGAALDSGTVGMALVQYYALDSGEKTLSWWGEHARGDHCPLSTCPTAPGVQAPGCPLY